MSDLVAVAYDDPHKAEEVRLKLIRLQKEYLIDLEDAVIVIKDAGGKVRLNQSHNLVAAGAASGGLWGSLIGLLFLNPLLGLAAGAGSGALAGYLTDVGIDDAFMKRLGEELRPGSSALFLLIRRATPDRVVAEVKEYGGTVLRTSLSAEDEGKLRAALEGEARRRVEGGEPMGGDAPEPGGTPGQGGGPSAG